MHAEWFCVDGIRIILGGKEYYKWTHLVCSVKYKRRCGR